MAKFLSVRAKDFDVRQQEALEFLKEFLIIEPTTTEIHELLRDGLLLGQLASRLNPNGPKPKLGTSIMHQTSNFSLFINSLDKLEIPLSCRFSFDDLREKKNHARIVDCILSLRAAINPNSNSTSISISISNSVSNLSGITNSVNNNNQEPSRPRANSRRENLPRLGQEPATAAKISTSQLKRINQPAIVQNDSGPLPLTLNTNVNTTTSESKTLNVSINLNELSSQQLFEIEKCRSEQERLIQAKEQQAQMKREALQNKQKKLENDEAKERIQQLQRDAEKKLQIKLEEEQLRKQKEQEEQLRKQKEQKEQEEQLKKQKEQEEQFRQEQEKLKQVELEKQEINIENKNSNTEKEQINVNENQLPEINVVKVYAIYQDGTLLPCIKSSLNYIKRIGIQKVIRFDVPITEEEEAEEIGECAADATTSESVARATRLRRRKQKKIYKEKIEFKRLNPDSIESEEGEELDVDPVIKEGRMSMKGGDGVLKRKVWKAFWLLLRSDKLHIFEDKGDRTSSLGEIQLKGSIVKDISQMQSSFSLVTELTTWTLLATSKKEQSLWVNAIGESIARASRFL
eukprot:TRINITY_DN5090_c1_g1_i3.p1 TRINITY_DN5090_c1_g1~~TRINITY_DN5090_c1_g1_i3.p1  ORF type:complete len:573 (+),score=281.30 TRINITY_DN5090_c1_g1_i3:47-1765(+)